MTEYDLDLYWHALNYRTAHTADADYCWNELESCVERLIAKKLETVIAQRDAAITGMVEISRAGRELFTSQGGKV